MAGPPADVAVVAAVGCCIVLQQTLQGLSCHSSAAEPGRSKPRLPCHDGTSSPASGPQPGTQRPARQRLGRHTGSGLS